MAYNNVIERLDGTISENRSVGEAYVTGTYKDRPEDFGVGMVQGPKYLQIIFSSVTSCQLEGRPVPGYGSAERIPGNFLQ